jgi:hypothetical protein
MWLCGFRRGFHGCYWQICLVSKKEGQVKKPVQINLGPRQPWSSSRRRGRRLGAVVVVSAPWSSSRRRGRRLGAGLPVNGIIAT